ncbi:MAG: nuclear transport factor 2 family protein, partial [bacterium]
KLHEYSESMPDIKLWGNTAIASYTYDVSWEMNGKSYKESGKDLFVFTYENGKWQAVWRKLMPNKENN